VTAQRHGSGESNGQRVAFAALTSGEWPVVIDFMLRLDDETLWRRFKSTRMARSILDHFDRLRTSETRLFAARREEIIALAELYAIDPDWSRAELVITCDPRAASDYLIGELSQLAILELAKLEAAELHLDRREYTRYLSRYFGTFPIIRQDEERLHLDLLDEAG
jgi:hypothetical protein